MTEKLKTEFYRISTRFMNAIQNVDIIRVCVCTHAYV